MTSYSRLVDHLSFPGAGCEPKVVEDISEVANAVLHVCLRGRIEGTIISKQQVIYSVCAKPWILF